MDIHIGNQASAMPRHFLKEWRLLRSLTQEQLAEKMESDKGTVSRLESGKKRFHEDMIYKAADALDISPDQLFREPNAKSLDRLLCDVPEDMKDHIFTMVAALAKQRS